jgi:Fur family transcriptional regulator, ferric uptake regulator
VVEQRCGRRTVVEQRCEASARRDHTATRLERVTTDWQEKLRAQGYRLTPQRELVLAAVDALGHGTPDEILAEVRKQSSAVNISTIYRTLELLESLDLVRHTHLSDRAPTYHSRSGPDHVHLKCRGCETVIDAEPQTFEPLVAELRRHHGFEPDVGHLTVFGQCADCRAAAEDAATART